MLEHIKLQNILFLDVETVPVAPSFPTSQKTFRNCGQKKLNGKEKMFIPLKSFILLKLD